MKLYDSWQWKLGKKWKIDHTNTTQTDLGLDMDTGILNIKCASVLNNT